MEIVKDEPKISEKPNLSKELPKSVYDPRKKYTWKPTDNFVISGNDFGLVLNALRQLLSTPEAQTILLAERASDVIENTFGRYVEEGVIVEIKEPVKSK